MAEKKVTAKKATAKKTPAKKKSSAPIVPPTMIQPGDMAPDFTVSDHDDVPVTLGSLRGQKVVLYFYPRDNTPGCTTEALDFSALLDEFKARNTVVYGISTDTTESHRKFQAKRELTVPLLADPERVVHTAFGAWGTKNLYGRVYEGTLRSTFLIDEEGRVARVWPKVRVANHAQDVLDAL